MIPRRTEVIQTGCSITEHMLMVLLLSFVEKILLDAFDKGQLFTIHKKALEAMTMSSRFMDPLAQPMMSTK